MGSWQGRVGLRTKGVNLFKNAQKVKKKWFGKCNIG